MEFILDERKIELINKNAELPYHRKQIIAKYFDPNGRATWLITSAEKQDDDLLFYGMCFIFGWEFGPVMFSELNDVTWMSRYDITDVIEDESFPTCTIEKYFENNKLKYPYDIPKTIHLKHNYHAKILGHKNFQKALTIIDGYRGKPLTVELVKNLITEHEKEDKNVSIHDYLCILNPDKAIHCNHLNLYLQKYSDDEINMYAEPWFGDETESDRQEWFDFFDKYKDLILEAYNVKRIVYTEFLKKDKIWC